MVAISPRTRLIATLVVAGVGLALFFGGEYHDIDFPLGWIGTFLFVAAVLKADVFQLPVPIGHNPDASAAGRSIGTLFVAWYVLSYVVNQRWAGKVERDERDARIAQVAGGWAHCTTAVAIIAIAVLLGFSDTERLREFSYPFIAHMLMLALLAGLWIEQVGAALLYWRDRRGA